MSVKQVLQFKRRDSGHNAVTNTTPAVPTDVRLSIRRSRRKLLMMISHPDPAVALLIERNIDGFAPKVAAEFAALEALRKAKQAKAQLNRDRLIDIAMLKRAGCVKAAAFLEARRKVEQCR